MEIDRISSTQSNVIQEIHPAVLDKSLNEKEDAVTVAEDNAQNDVRPETPGSGQKVDLFA